MLEIMKCIGLMVVILLASSAIVLTLGPAPIILAAAGAWTWGVFIRVREDGK